MEINNSQLRISNVLLSDIDNFIYTIQYNQVGYLYVLQIYNNKIFICFAASDFSDIRHKSLLANKILLLSTIVQYLRITLDYTIYRDLKEASVSNSDVTSSFSSNYYYRIQRVIYLALFTICIKSVSCIDIFMR